VTPSGGERDQRAAAGLILVMRGLRLLAYGLLAVILGVVLASEGFSPKERNRKRCRPKTYPSEANFDRCIRQIRSMAVCFSPA